MRKEHSAGWCLLIIVPLQAFNVTTTAAVPSFPLGQGLPPSMQLVARMTFAEVTDNGPSVPQLLVVSSKLQSGQNASLSTMVNGEWWQRAGEGRHMCGSQSPFTSPTVGFCHQPLCHCAIETKQCHSNQMFAVLEAVTVSCQHFALRVALPSPASLHTF